MAERIYDIKEIAKRTKESLAEKFPNLTFKVTFDRRGGSTMNVRLMKGDFNPFTDPTNVKSLPINWRWIKNDDNLTDEAKKVLSEVVTISQKYNWDNSDPMTDYYDVNYYLNMSIGLPDEKPYEYNPPKSKRTKSDTSGTPTPSSSSAIGDVLMSCSGWTIYKKTLDDGRIVYNVKINKDTTPNKADWDLIKGEVYTETQFRWGKFGAFVRWGQIKAEADVFKKLCDVLGKYYTAGTTTVPLPNPAPLPETQKGKEFDIYINGRYYQKAESLPVASEILVSKFGQVTVDTMFQDGRINREGNRINVLENSFIYGKSWNVSQYYGNELAFYLIDKGFYVYNSVTNKRLIIYKNSMANDGLLITDNGGEFNVTNYSSNTFIGSVNYVLNDVPASPIVLSEVLRDIYENEFEQQTTKPTTAPKVDDTIPANPKLRFCRIVGAEGLPEYTSLFPRDFSSFTQLTKFIADNIGQLEERGYDKHWIEWKWIWEEEDTPNNESRWDIGENSENPKKFPNLFAFNEIQNILYWAWNIAGDDYLSERDDRMAEKLGKDGLEIDNMQFAEIYNAVQSGYKPDKKRFKYNTPVERLARFKEVYPKTDRLFSNKKSKEDIQKAIKGLQYLADRGNENAKKAIKGLQYLLNK